MIQDEQTQEQTTEPLQKSGVADAGERAVMVDVSVIFSGDFTDTHRQEPGTKKDSWYTWR